MLIPDLSTQTYRAHGNDGFEYRSAGWLGDQVTTPEETDPFVVAVLLHLWNVNQLPEDSREEHSCEVCAAKRSPTFEAEMPPGQSSGVERFDRGRGEFFVEDGSTRFVLPNLVLHYIVRHHYKLPDVVEAAVLGSAVFTREEWEEATGAREAAAKAAVQEELAAARRRGRKHGLGEGHCSGFAEGLFKGEIDGRIEALLRVFSRSGIALDDHERARIEACADPAILDRWLGKVLGAKSAAEVLS
jgi:hypothetical protein